MSPAFPNSAVGTNGQHRNTGAPGRAGEVCQLLCSSMLFAADVASLLIAPGAASTAADGV